MPIPQLRDCGILPSGIHCCSFQEVETFFVSSFNSPKRDLLWQKFVLFCNWIRPLNIFPGIYIDGSFVTDKSEPGDIDVVLELPENINISVLMSTPIFDKDYIKNTFYIHIFPWVPEIGVGDDLRFLFQRLKKEEYLRRNIEPWELKGILRVAL